MWAELTALDKKIEALSSRVRRATSPEPASAREMTTMLAQEITCTESDLSERYATFYNGSGESIVLHRLSVGVQAQPSSFVATGQRVGLGRFAWGFVGGRTASADIYQIDFVWNYLISSRQSAYSRQPVGSTMFNGRERGQTFDLYEPLVVKPADSIEFRVRPIAYLPPGTTGKTTNTTYFINFLGIGYRRPV